MHRIKLFAIICILINVSGCRKKTDIPILTEKQNEIDSAVTETEIQKNDADLAKENNENYPLELIGSEEVNYDGSLYFWNLNTDDDIDTVKEKLNSHDCKFEEGTDYANVYKIWNKGIIIEEWENLDFMITYYNQNLVTFTKWNISLQELQKICQFYGESVDVSKLKNPQYYIFRRGNYEISVGNEGYYDALHKGDLFVLYITNSELAKQVQKKYDSFD